MEIYAMDFFKMANKSLKELKIKGAFRVGNDRGLHTRPSTEIVKCAIKFKSEIFLVHQKTRANAKSLLGILMLAASKGTKILVEACGEDAEQAIASLLELAKNKFNIHY